jgi:drug/metabolite transporter (DMT)-like permease
LFGFHFLLFIALRHAPPVQANLVNYLWPLGMVVMAPLFLPGVKLTPTHLLAACIGFAGACIAILGRASESTASGFTWGYLPAAGSAFIWASYSLLTKRLAMQGRSFATAAIGLFGLVSGLLSLLCHAFLEPRVNLSGQDWMLLIALGMGPLGAAFYLWDAALKRGDARQIGILSYITPLASTAVLLIATSQPLSWSIGLAAALIVGAAVLGTRAK